MNKILLRFITVILLLNILFENVYTFEVGQGNKDGVKLKTVACIFAGREKYLSILMPYLNKLREGGKLEEIHFWQFTNNKDDIKYLESMSNLHKTSKNFNEYRNIKPVINDNEFNLKIKARNDAHILINDTYEIVIGGWYNTKSVIRMGEQGMVISEAPARVLDENEYRDFAFGIKNNSLYVKGLMGVKIEDTEIKSIKIHTGWGSEGYWEYDESENKGMKLFDTEKRVGCNNWGEAYRFYLNYDFELFLKIDDDIVYMDLDRYDEFIEYIVRNPYNNFVFPNMVNHSVSLFYNNKHGLIPDEILFDKYKYKQHCDDLYWHYTDGQQAMKIHEYFLNNISKFTNNTMNPINLNGHKESICMFGISKRNYNKMFNEGLRNITIKSFYGTLYKTSLENFDDEVYVYNWNGNVWYPRFVVCHYQFGPQMKSGLDESFLPRYKKLADEITSSK